MCVCGCVGYYDFTFNMKSPGRSLWPSRYAIFFLILVSKKS